MSQQVRGSHYTTYDNFHLNHSPDPSHEIEIFQFHTASKYTGTVCVCVIKIQPKNPTREKKIQLK